VPEIPDSFKFKNTPVVVKGAVEKEVEAGVKSTVQVPNNSIPSSSPNLKEKVSESEIGLLSDSGVENQEKENQTKRGMDMLISKVMHSTLFLVMFFILYCFVVQCLYLHHLNQSIKSFFMSLSFTRHTSTDIIPFLFFYPYLPVYYGLNYHLSVLYGIART
jgi:hypothetical protein